MKRLLLLLCGLMSLVMSVHAATFTYTYKGHTLNYRVLSESEGTCYVTGYISGPVGALELPDFPVNINNGIEYTLVAIAGSAFRGCSDLTSVIIPNSVKIIGDGAFFECTGLISVIIGNSVDDIGIGAFNGCTGLTSVVIGNSVKSIGHSAFANCSRLKSVEIPYSVLTIGEQAFVYCTGLTSVVIGNSVKNIGYGAFAYCSELTSIVIPNSVQTIDEVAFYNCTSLTSVVIGNSVKSIGYDAFENCSGLKKSAYPDNIPNPFSSGKAIAYPAQETTIEDGVIFDRAKTTLYFAPVTLSGEYTVPSTVKTITDNAFSYCEDITYIRMPATLSSIGKNVFLGCKLYDFTIPNAVKSFDMATLSGNPLKSLTVGSGVTQISGAASFLSPRIEKIFWLGNNPPEGCYSFNADVNFISNDQYEFGNQILYPFLSSMFDVEGIVYVPVSPSERTCNVVDYFYAPSNAVFSVPATVTYKGIQLKVIDIGAYAFYHHDYLTDITLDNNGVIDDYAFYNCIKLQSVTFGNNIPEIKNHTFEKCEVLKKVENSPALISIGEWAFSRCVGMEYFSVGDKATSFGKEAFSDCTGLTEFYSYAATPPVCGDQALDDIRKWNCKLYVPIGSEKLYKDAPQWKDFFFRIGIESGIDTIFIDPQNNNIEIFDINGIKQTKRLEDLPAGIYIVRQGKNVKKIAVR
ncbi:MAG: leucine-rich repeat protein [Duncaniella sp.]|uniref:leucine-rich repeat domain-containing protein n=1 Tax=Duncaniella sp. TaxID=2518496 RepID=UPI0023CD3345|nr:leucine-rich repeat domain-containing protein [Duncaniella sp.]MDE5989836.1 leucine-rich repeat protein [Duncaniella sp.]